MRAWTASITVRLAAALALLLLVFGAIVAVLGHYVAVDQEQEALQRLSRGLAQHIVNHWPEMAHGNEGAAVREAREAVLAMLMVVNPGVQVYLLDAGGRVQHYLGEPATVPQPEVDLQPVRAFLSGAPLPVLGTDPMGSGRLRAFSVAPFSPRAGAAAAPGYLYVVLDGRPREQLAGPVSLERVWRGAILVLATALLLTLVLGIFVFHRLSLPLRRLAQRLHAFGRPTDAAGEDSVVSVDDEVEALSRAFQTMTARIDAQATRERDQAAAHRETMAGVAHDLRTPLTALHGQLEALAGGGLAQPAARERVLTAALAQSERVRRLTQQLFELAALQSGDQVLHRERFRVDELVTDTVQKFEAAAGTSAVTLAGSEPGRVEVDGDLQLIERALSNLIDNAIRHAPGSASVEVSLRRQADMVQIVVEDAGPGLPDDLLQRLQQGLPPRDASLRQPASGRGGIGGLGLAIAQRIAALHGGSLRALPAPLGGTRLCLALPAAA